MRKLVFITFLLNGYFLNAQIDPLQQFFNKSFISSLIEYDSIAVSQDTGINFSAYATAAQHYFTNGNIDTLYITQIGIPDITYSGKLSGRTTTVTGSEIVSTTLLDRLIVKQDSLYRDSSIEYYNHTGSSFQLFFEAVISHISPTSDTVDFLDIYADMGQGLVRVGGYNYYYDALNRLDSIFYTVSTTSMDDGYYKYEYDANSPSKLLKISTYQDIDNNGEKDLIQELRFRHNAQNEVVEINEFGLDPNTNNLFLLGAYRYSKRKNSTINLQEVGKINVSLYPNPAYNYLQIDFAEKLFSEFEIYSTAGKHMLSGQLQNRINVEALPKGLYILSLKGKSGIGSVTFEKM